VKQDREKTNDEHAQDHARYDLAIHGVRLTVMVREA
jgi:hypothetical protein